MRKRNALAAIVVSGIMVGGAGIAMGGEVAQDSSSAPHPSVQVRTDRSAGIGTPEQTGAAGSGSGLVVGTVAEATDAIIRNLGDGRVTEVALAQENGRTVWRVTIDQGKGPVRVTLDATTGQILRSAALSSESSDDCAGAPGSGTGAGGGGDIDDGDDDDDDDSDDDDDDDGDDDDGGPVREGVDPNK
ncbi:PepSY domain-containing protein [Streptomyces sp. Amel2xC10]|uniref:PepSY domain-containing protein n=1 Tax=Streptomyces sp. Amel2xC10 TaxID=1305826 RepID=UPI000A08E96F|nr:PepSY domain-containing protein [Streptomyces sp. Amel2xC10]SMF32166.1 Peptidase propeptide and YPEB domain-containing protein [Streptomyces sp. Amel2xC10]